MSALGKREGGGGGGCGAVRFRPHTKSEGGGGGVSGASGPIQKAGRWRGGGGGAA